MLLEFKLRYVFESSCFEWHIVEDKCCGSRNQECSVSVKSMFVGCQESFLLHNIWQLKKKTLVVYITKSILTSLESYHQQNAQQSLLHISSEMAAIVNVCILLLFSLL